MSAAPLPAIVTIGNFDGVHLGHQMLLRQVVDRARSLGVRSYAVTFEPHPEQVLFPERRLTHLSSAEERVEAMQACGVDAVWICKFTSELARLEPEEFIRLIAERQPIAELWVGADFAMGRGRKGTLAVLAELGSALGWAVHMVPPLRYEGQVVSSTAIRTLLAAGAVRGAADLLGRPYSVRAEIPAGGEVSVDPLRALPRQGTYVGQVADAGEFLVTVVGTPGKLQVESTAQLPSAPVSIQFARRAD